MHTTTLALVGATGGAGTTRTAVELAAVGARGGHDVVVIDAAFTTQGLSEYVAGRIDTDLTALVTDETESSLSAAAYPIGDRSGAERDTKPGPERDSETNREPRRDENPRTRDTDTPGRVDAVPARAPFERLARSKTAAAARKLERRIDEAVSTYDAVILDVAPVGSNEAVAAVTAADRVEAVRPASAHGRDALQRLRGRIADVSATVDGAIAVARGGRGERTEERTDAETVLPAVEPAVAAAPTAASGDDAYARAAADAYERAFGASLGLEFDDHGLIDRLRPSR
ncbi:P-loop NTPase family protein [Halorubrum pallidum]